MTSKIKKVILNTIAASGLVSGSTRIKLYNKCGMDLKHNTFGSKCYFSGTKLSVGEGSWINFGCSFENHLAEVIIGKNCAVAMGVLFCTSTHKVGSSEKRAGDDMFLPITVGDGCWIGANATLLPGVTIGEGCIIAAGAVVAKDCEPNSLYAGVPAQKIKDLPIEERKYKLA